MGEREIRCEGRARGAMRYEGRDAGVKGRCGAMGRDGARW